jgi:L-threonylcarbamoyladenylate synthase
MSTALLTLETAREAINDGSLVVFPTETFFAVGCDAMNPDAVGAVFSVKKRSLSMPLPVVIAGRDALAEVAAYVPKLALALMDAFWPGPLSIVFPARPEVPELLTANMGRIAVRCSPHQAARDLCAATGKVLVASSANQSGRQPVAGADDLDPEILAGTTGLYLVGPKPAGVFPSTVVDVLETRGKPLVRVLRPGAVSLKSIREAGFTVQSDYGDAADARA